MLNNCSKMRNIGFPVDFSAFFYYHIIIINIPKGMIIRGQNNGKY